MPPDYELPDEALALGIQRGNVSDLIHLVERHHHDLVGYLYRLSNGDRMWSEDMVQETFLRVLHNIQSYQHPRPFKPWLYAIATNLARNHFKRADTRHTISVENDELDIPIAGNLPEESLIADDETRKLITALDKLPTHQREVIILRYTQDLSLADMADVLDISIGTVKSRLSLGLRRLRTTMKESNA